MLSLLISFVLISAVFSITGRSKFAILSLILIIPALLLSWLNFILDSSDILILSRLLSLFVIVLVTFSVFLEVVRSKSPIPRHIIWGAIAVYLMIGLSFAMLYQLTNTITPGSFYFSVDPSAMLNFSDFVYFSFVTLATLGYGDIIPLTAQARSFAIIEAITGSLYLAVLIAKIVSLSIASSVGKNGG
ncbi:MAG: potassium channel family protein [Methanomassiliicoccales archaeon]|nr:potassium channel family protein [Methanomassiliicoccales archaeon]